MLLADTNKYKAWLERGAASVAVLQSIGADLYGEFEKAKAADMEGVKVVDSTAIVQINGPLSYKYDFWSWLMGGASYQGLSAQLSAIENDSSVDRVILVMDTPGGEVTGITELAEQIASSTKQVIAFIDPCCASAGLWIASQADRITGVKSLEIGSLGVQAMTVSYAEMFKKAGIDISIFRAAISPDKNLGHPYEPMNDDAKEYIQGRVDKYGQAFVSMVAKGRGKDDKYVMENFGKGRMLDAEEAMAVGLIDDVTTWGALMAEGRKKGRSNMRSKARRI